MVFEFMADKEYKLWELLSRHMKFVYYLREPEGIGKNSTGLAFY
jgi:hypothetical protein